MTVHHWDRLTREELAARAGASVLVLPVASTEQHGPHLATRTDTALLEAVLDRALPQIPEDAHVLVAPTLCYGASDHHIPFGATLSLRTTTRRSVLEDLVRSAAAAGCHRVLLLNGHGGNALTCGLAATDAVAQHDILVGSAAYWDLLDGDDEHGFPLPGHAGRFETALALAVDPDLVRVDAEVAPPATAEPGVPGVQVVHPNFWRRIGGFTDDPRPASAELGETLLRRLAKAVAGAIVAVARA